MSMFGLIEVKIYQLNFTAMHTTPPPMFDESTLNLKRHRIGQ